MSPRKTKQSLSDSECSLKTTGENFHFGKSQSCTASWYLSHWFSYLGTKAFLKSVSQFWQPASLECSTPYSDQSRRLQTFVLWILFFNLCLGALYTNWDESQGEGKNDSIFVNVPFVVLNASVLLLAIGKSTCCSVLFNMHLSHLPKKSRKVTVDDGGFLNPKFFRFRAMKVLW